LTRRVAARAGAALRAAFSLSQVLPPHAPDLHPVETLWTNRERQELANLATDRLGEVTAAAWRGIQRVRGVHHLPDGIARRCGI
jgi:hypothetical protein